MAVLAMEAVLSLSDAVGGAGVVVVVVVPVASDLVLEDDRVLEADLVLEDDLAQTSNEMSLTIDLLLDHPLPRMIHSDHDHRHDRCCLHRLHHGYDYNKSFNN
jgi:hypothetical protein